jgi:hypothetical protein
MDRDQALSRRAVLLAVVGGGAAFAARAIGAPAPAGAASAVQLGATNTSSRATTLLNTNASASAKAIVGRATGAGVNGANSTNGNSGALGSSSSGVVGLASSTNGNGLFGTANTGSLAYGVWGTSSSGSGVVGNGKGYGVRGSGTTGVQGTEPTSTNYGQLGVATSGVRGYGMSAQANGVFGEANNGIVAFGVWGRSTSGYAGYFSGDVQVTGDLNSTAASFRIDHPADPENRFLQQAYVAGDERLSVYSGNVRTDRRGLATVRLPGYVEDLNTDFRYQLTVIGSFAQAIVDRRVAGGRFRIRTTGPSTDVSWQVTGVRRDAFARSAPFRAVTAKRGSVRGRLLRPDLHGRGRESDLTAIGRGARARSTGIPAGKAIDRAEIRLAAGSD